MQYKKKRKIRIILHYYHSKYFHLQVILLFNSLLFYLSQSSWYLFLVPNLSFGFIKVFKWQARQNTARLRLEVVQ